MIPKLHRKGVEVLHRRRHYRYDESVHHRFDLRVIVIFLYHLDTIPNEFVIFSMIHSVCVVQ